MLERPANRVPIISQLELLWELVESPSNFPFTVPAIKNLEKLEFHPAVTFLVGENGSGKSTLLEAIAARLDFDEIGGSAR